MILNTLRLFADAADGTGAETKPATETKPEGEPGEKSRIAVTGEKTERELKLETELENERARASEEEKKRIARERELADVNDKFDRYRQTVETKPAKHPFVLPTVLD